MLSALMRISFWTTAAVLVFLMHGTAFAEQTATGSTSTGSTLPIERTTADIIASVRALTPGRVPLKLASIIINAQKQKAWENESAIARARQAEHRRECREAIRKANKDTLMSRVLQCYRSDLLQDVNIFHKQSQYFGAIPLLDPTTKSAATGAIVKLIDAEMTIIDGIDAGLFERVEQLEQAKKNLRANYREAYWLHLLKLHADRELSWNVFMLKSIEDRLSPENTPEKAAILKVMASCLEEASMRFHAAKTAPDRLNVAKNIANGRLQAAACQASFTALAKQEAEENAAQSE